MMKKRKKHSTHRRPAVHPNRTYRDSLFRFLFGNPDHKEWTLSLFNAINRTDYTDPEEIEFRFTGDILFIKIHEDVVFLYGSTLTFFEHQSTWSPNLPYRMLEYAAKQMSVMTEKSELSIYSGTMMKLPKPKFYVLYNGNDKNVPPQSTLRLSQCYDTNIRIDDLGNSYDLEVIVHVFNINYGCNQTVPEKCRVLEEYTWIVSSIRKETESGRSLNDAINHSIEMIPEDFVIHNVILAERGRVAAMLFDKMGDARQIEKLRYELRE